jgi:hypothetical protein
MGTAFDELDARMSAAVGRSFEDTVIWRPMLPKSASQYIVQPGGNPDRNRPLRELPGIITWATTGLEAVQGSPGGGIVGTATLMIDFEIALFEEPEFAMWGAPRKGDWLEMPHEKRPADRLAEISRIGDDGSARFYCWCTLVND